MNPSSQRRPSSLRRRQTANEIPLSRNKRAQRRQCAAEAEFLDAWTCHFTLKPDVYKLLEAMKATRPFVICSNTNAAHWDFLNRRCGLDRLAAKAILSHECGCEKPAPEIYRLAAAAHGREPSECLFVDDLAAQVEAAKALGFHTHHFMGYEAPP
jgi:HAD superfamily hydrolase (TIGR01509 family)